jgi:branched-chain amino acid transport system permease protein
MTRSTALLLVAIASLTLGLVPILAPPFYANLLIPFYGYAIALLGFNLLFGYAGLLSFGHALFLGIGAYAAAVIAGVCGIREFEVVLVGAALAGGAVALPLGWLAVRYTGIFFGMLTLAFGMLAHSILFKFYHLTGGDSGMRVPRMRLIGLEFAAYNKIELLAGPFYFYCLALSLLAALLMWRIVGSPFGLHLRSLRDNAQKAEYLGVRVHQFRMAAFAISGIYGAVGGAILGFRTGLADPELVYWTHSGHLVFMTVLGGFTHFLGPVIGALAMTLLQDQLQSFTQYWRLLLGAILALVVIFLPRGLAGLACDAGARLGRRPAAPARLQCSRPMLDHCPPDQPARPGETG